MNCSIERGPSDGNVLMIEMNKQEYADAIGVAESELEADLYLHAVPIAAIGVYGVLLGTSSHAQTLKEILTIRHTGEPVEAGSKYSVWHDSYDEIRNTLKFGEARAVARLSIASDSIDDAVGIAKTRQKLGLDKMSAVSLMRVRDDSILNEALDLAYTKEDEISEAVEQLVTCMIDKKPFA